MTKRKKPTIKELEERINVLAYNLNHTKMMLDNVGFAFSKYIDFKGDTTDYKKHLENIKNVDKLEENVKNDRK